MRAKLQTAFSLIILLAAIHATVSAQRLRAKEYDIGLAGCYWFEGEQTAGGRSITKESAFLLRVFGDYFLMPKLGMGAYFNYTPYTQGEREVKGYEFGVSIKPRFFVGRGFVIKPGLNLGYRFTTSEYEKSRIDAFGANLSLEFQQDLGPVALLFEGGFLAQPAGGNDAIELTFAPIFYVGMGVVY